MADRSVEERVAVLERFMGGRTLEDHFREHAELSDRRFAEMHARFTELHARFTAQDKRFEAMDERFNRVDYEIRIIRRDLSSVRDTVNLILIKLDRLVPKRGLRQKRPLTQRVRKHRRDPLAVLD